MTNAVQRSNFSSFRPALGPALGRLARNLQCTQVIAAPASPASGYFLISIKEKAPSTPTYLTYPGVPFVEEEDGNSPEASSREADAARHSGQVAANPGALVREHRRLQDRAKPFRLQRTLRYAQPTIIFSSELGGEGGANR